MTPAPFAARIRRSPIPHDPDAGSDPDGAGFGLGPEVAALIAGTAGCSPYLRGLMLREPSYWPGHNPMGALSVIAMLAVLAAQVSSGLISDPDDYINVGPLASYVSGATRSKAVGWHNLGANLILVLVLLHVAVILFYRYWKREDLVRPMITGRKQVRED